MDDEGIRRLKLSQEDPCWRDVPLTPVFMFSFKSQARKTYYPRLMHSEEFQCW